MSTYTVGKWQTLTIASDPAQFRPGDLLAVTPDGKIWRITHSDAAPWYENLWAWFMWVLPTWNPCNEAGPC